MSWPGMLISLELTFEEGSILREHCEVAAASSPAAAPVGLPKLGYKTQPVDNYIRNGVWVWKFVCSNKVRFCV